MLSRDNLHGYQETAIKFIKDNKRVALWLGLGLGKTTSSLTAASDLLDSMAINRVLVVAPLRVANTVWAQEAAQWSHLKHLRVAVCTGGEKQRLSALQHEADIYTINRENIPWLVKHYAKKWPFDAVIIDESSSFKNAGSQRFKALKKVLDQDPRFVPDTLPSLIENSRALNQMDELSRYLFDCLEKTPSISIVIELSKLVKELEGEEAGAYVLSEYLKKRPSVKGLDRLISVQMQQAAGDVKENLGLLRAFTQRLIKDKPIYRCEECGFDGKTLHWQCPTCKSWGTVKPIQGLEGE